MTDFPDVAPFIDRACSSCGGPLGLCHADECADWIEEHIICLRSGYDEDECSGPENADLVDLVERLRAASLIASGGPVFRGLYREAADAISSLNRS